MRHLALAFDGPAARLRLGGALLLITLLLVFWIQTVVPPVRSSITARGAQELLEMGETQLGVDRYFQAIAEDPSSVANRLRVGSALFAAAGNETDSENQIILLTAAVGEASQILQRNPLDHRAWSRAGEFQRELAIAQDDVTKESLLGSQTLVGLMPGFWQSWAALAFAYFRIGDDNQATSLADEAIRISNGAPRSSFAHYVKAVALESLGRFDESIVAANEAVRLGYSLEAQELLTKMASRGLDTAF